VADDPNKVPAASWNRVFQQDPDGLRILDELAMENVYVSTFDADPIQMARKAARAELVLEIMAKAGQ
jgi:hypothetical protein